jgi:hypothetical protein
VRFCSFFPPCHRDQGSPGFMYCQGYKGTCNRIPLAILSASTFKSGHLWDFIVILASFNTFNWPLYKRPPPFIMYGGYRVKARVASLQLLHMAKGLL